MSNVRTKRGTIAILTGGGDVPGLNPAIRALTVRALREGYRVLGIRRGWAGLIELAGDRDQPDGDCVIELSEEVVNKVGRTGGTFLHTSRTRPSHVPKANVPEHLRDKYADEMNDLTPASPLPWPGWRRGWITPNRPAKPPTPSACRPAAWRPCSGRR